MVSGITEITHFTCKSDMSRWTRAHADSPGINWSVYPGPGGTMIVVEHEEDRCTLTASQAEALVAPEVSPGVVDSGDTVGLAASA